MFRPALTLLFSLGLVFGLASGFFSLHHSHERRHAFERHIADVCVDATLRHHDKR